MQRHIDKGNDLLEEAATLEQKGNPDAVAMKDLAKSLKQHLSSFSTRLEDQREKLEDTSKCYQLLDKVRAIIVFIFKALWHLTQ